MILTKEQIEDVKELRQATGEGLFFCKKALVQSNFDKAKALAELQKQMSRSGAIEMHKMLNGLVQSYIHMDKIGAMVILGTETDFCAKTDVIKEFAHQLCIHICAKKENSNIEQLNSPMFLLNQLWVYDESKTVEQILGEVRSRTGESVSIRKIVRFEL